MKFISSFILSVCSVLGFSQTILYQAESTSRTVQDPQSVIFTTGFQASSTVSNPFIAKIGPATENPGGGPSDSQAGVTNPSGTIAPTGQSFHDTKGDVDVTASGQLQFNQAIALPPGVKSVAPQINLVYTSGSPNGIAGYSWNISGITAITRISKNIDKDGAVKGIQADYSDYYSFNGQRLVLKSGEYGKDGAEYVTEKYSNVKIKSIGTVAGQMWKGPEYWEITFEDGSQAWFGGTVVGSSSARTPLEYNIVKWRDIKGNYITYNYTQSDNVAVISSIQWGGNEPLGKSHFNIIEFNYYNTRTLKEINYLSGIEFIQNKLLKEIVVKSNGNQFKRYAIEYADNGTSYQFAKKIIEYNGENIAANPVIFNYEQNNTTEYIPYQSFSATNGTKKYADFNLDGETDYIEFVSNGVLKYRSSLYKDVSDVTLSYDSSKFASGDFSRATPITFKKDNYIKNNIGLVVPVKKESSQPDMFDIELQIYSVDVASQQLVFEYSKTLSHDQYFVGDDTYKIDGWLCNFNFFIVSANAYDHNGDGVSELVLNINRILTCTDPSIFQPTDPTNPTGGSGVPQQPTNPNDYTVTTQFYTTLLYDLDQNSAPDNCFYVLDQEAGTNVSVNKPTRLFADRKSVV